MPHRLFIVGTDTEVGKTTVSVALLRAASSASARVLPFKPAVSGDLSTSSDHARLARAVPELSLDGEAISVHRFQPPIAPGLAQEGHRFYERASAPHGANASTPEIESARQVLESLEQRLEPDATLIEGAGGLHVPMPGGTWLGEWITAFDALPVVVGRAGRGTINHTILTVEALRAQKRPPPAFLFSCTQPQDRAIGEDNRRVVEARLGIPCLGVLPHQPNADAQREEAWLRSDALRLLGLAN
jgi:dethiobiotin synthetase